MSPDKTRHSESLPSAYAKDGDKLEAAVAEVLFWEGFFVRRSVNLQRHYHPEPLQVTDLDIVAVQYDKHLRANRLIGEVKGGKGRSAAKPLDRSIWMAGLGTLVRADRLELIVNAKLSQRLRELAQEVGVRTQSLDDIDRRFGNLTLGPLRNAGSQGTDSVESLQRFHMICSQDPQMERGYWFLRSEVWFLGPWSACKRTLGLIRQMADRYAPAIDDEEKEALTWILTEALSIFSVSLVSLVSISVELGEEAFRSLANQRLAEGAVPIAQMTRLSEAIDKYVGGLLANLEAPPNVRVDAMGAFLPTEPDYSESLCELVNRLAKSSSQIAEIPRQVDFLGFEANIRKRVPSSEAIARLGVDDQSRKAIRLIMTFLRGQARYPTELSEFANGPHTSALEDPASAPMQDSLLIVEEGSRRDAT